MEYLSLDKLFFKDFENYEKIYANRMNSESSIHFDIYIHKYPVFYIPINEMIGLVNEIQRYNSQVIEIIHTKMPKMALPGFIKQTLIEEIKMTNDIEGITSTRREIAKILTDVEKNKGKRLYGLVNKYNKLLDETENKVLTCKDIRTLYDEVLLHDIKNEDPKDIPDGIFFRKEGVDVNLNGRIIHQGVLPEQRIIEYIDKSLFILNNNTIPLLIRVAIFHYLFGYIHPFYDGNGRMNRLLSSYYLKQELHILSTLQVSVSCKEAQNKYIESFKICNSIRNRGDMTPFILSFLEIYRDGLQKLVNTLSKKSLQLEYYTKYTTEDIVIDDIVVEIIGYFIQNALFDGSGLSINTLKKIMKCSEPTARKGLQEVLQSMFKETIIYDKTAKPIIYHLDLMKLDILLEEMKTKSI